MPSLRDDFLAIDLTAIDRFVAERRQEDLRLDFKELAKSPDLDKTDRKNLAKAMSGFANSDGGLIVWGVEARKDADGIDAASATKPIPHVDAAYSKILNLTGEATGPIVDGGEHRVVKEPGADAGFIVTHVPRSDSGPHMARLGEGRYYKRSGDSFYPLEHFDLEDMFGRRPKPRLEVATHVLRGMGGSVGGIVSIGVDVVLSLRNVGRGIARFPFLKLLVDRSYSVTASGLDENKRHGLPMRPNVAGAQLPLAFHGGADDVVLPDDDLPVTKLRGGFTQGSPPRELKATCWFGADGVPMASKLIFITSAEIEAMLAANEAARSR